MRVIALVFVALLAAATFVVPQPPQATPRAPEAAAAAPFTVCPLSQTAQRTTVVPFIGGGAGSFPVDVFSGNEVQASTDVSIPEGGNQVLDVNEVTGLARSPLLVAYDNPSRTAETVLRGGGSAAAACTPGSSEPQVVLGGSTAEGSSYTVVLANPFAGSATVDVQAASEVGVESDPALEGVVVPPRSLVPVDLGNLLSGRQRISASVVTTSGRVVAGALHETETDISAAAGMTAASDWYVPMPAIDGMGRALVLMAPGTGEIPFQLDVYSSEGVVEAAYEGSVPAQGQVAIPASDLLEGPGMVRVVAAGPVAAGLTLAGEEGNAMVPGADGAAPAWQLPGAGVVGDTEVHVFNPGEVDVSATLLSGNGNQIETFDVPASATVVAPLSSRTIGARLEADGDVIVHWTTDGEEGIAGDVAQEGGG